MKFPYRHYFSRFPGTEDFRLLSRPVIRIRIAGPNEIAEWDALVDTGPDEILIPLKLAALLKIQLEEGFGSATGISGDKLKIQYGEVEFQIATEEESVAWRSVVGFAEFGASQDEVIILGHIGCLDYFTATFSGEASELELVPNELLDQL